MAGEMIKVLQRCGECNKLLGEFEVKKENMMLRTQASIWCTNCNSEVIEIRDIDGRLESLAEEQNTYPVSSPSGAATSKDINDLN